MTASGDVLRRTLSLCPLLPEISQLLTQTDARSARVETVELRPGQATSTGGRPSRAGAAQRDGDEKTETRGTFTVRGDSRDSTDDNRASVIHCHFFALSVIDEVASQKIHCTASKH